jgi:pimeloyl-ACP methyl ester carboxylesterase
MLCLNSSANATIECLRSFQKPISEWFKKINIPVLIIHGDADETVPITISGNKQQHSLPNAEYITYNDAPHSFVYYWKEKTKCWFVHFITT